MSSNDQQGKNANNFISVLNGRMNEWMSSYEQQGTMSTIVFLYWMDEWINEFLAMTSKEQCQQLYFCIEWMNELMNF